MNINKLFVFADFDWLEEPLYMGILFQDFLRGSSKYSFEFSKEWLNKYRSITLSADLNNYSGRQYVQSPLEFFACFSDCLPDRWGRLLLTRREQIQAEREARPMRQLSSFDYLLGIEDQTRLGGFRFKSSLDSNFLNIDDTLPIPPITSIRELAYAASQVEHSEKNKQLPEERWINQLVEPGSSLGGARPKASVQDADGSLWIAKFPSVNDLIDVGAWEHFAYTLAAKAHIEVAPSKIIPCGRHHIFLVKRFDRNESKRVHFASAMTLLGLKDGDGAASGYGYLDIAEKIIQLCPNTEVNLESLFRRVAFNICIGNCDDHFRNHGFLLSKDGWDLSPAYDLNPSLNRSQSLLITENSNESNLKLLLGASENYFLSGTKAQTIIEEVLCSMDGWEQEALKLGLSISEINMFSTRFQK